MGDVAIMVPVLRTLVKQHPHLKITVLTRAFFKPLFRDLKNVSVVVADVKGAHKGINGLYKLTKQLNATYSFCAVADLHNVLRSKIIRTFIKSKHIAVIDKGREEKKALTTGEIFKQLKTTHQRYADVFFKLGFPVDLSQPIFPKPKTINTTLLGKKIDKWIGIAPFAAHSGKMYPLDLMGKVVEALSKQYKIILFGGGKEEMEILDTFEAKFENCVNLAGKLSFEEELDIISNLDVMLAMDSGNGHLAAMFGVKTIAIWGVTHPFAGFAPFNQPKNYMLLADRAKYPKIPTSVYGNKVPKGYENAAGSITYKMVVDKVKEAIGGSEK